MLRIETLGGLTIRQDGEPATELATRKVAALLVYLACTDRACAREVLAELLWEERTPERAQANLRWALTNLRKNLGDYLLITRATVAISPEAEVRLDVRDLDEHIRLGQIEAAVELYQGEFLQGFYLRGARVFDRWAAQERERLHLAVVDALHRQVDHDLAGGAFRAGIERAQRLLALDPLQETAHRQMMLLLAASGQRSAALSQYETCRELLIEELGAEPSLEVRETYELLRSGERPPGIPLAPAAWEQEPGPVAECPYRGLAAFREEDAPFFFGREAFTQRLLQAVQVRPLVAVIVGSSGSGKSSVVFAGLLPRLLEGGDRGGWMIADLRPGMQPFRSLAGSLAPLMSPDLDETGRLVQARKLAEALHSGDLPLADAMEHVLKKQPQGQCLLLVVDQFEELYTLCPEQEVRYRFLDELLAVLEAADAPPEPRCVLLLTMRADFMGRALAHRPFADALQEACVMLGPMNREELAAAVEQPARVQGAAFEAGLVERILDDVGQEPGNLPLLEFALTLLWERQSYGWLNHAGYEEIGKVEGALARYADEVFSELDAEAQEQTRQVFVQLVRPGEGTEDTRRVATQAEVGEENWRLVQHLADRRLVVTGHDEAEIGTVEVVHEALIQGWGRLRDWMEADRAFRTWQERLRVALRQWEMTEGDEGALLRGAPLAEAEGWLAERGKELGEAERAFVQAGLALRERRAIDKEARRQRELEAARALAVEQEKRADVEQRRAEEQTRSAGRLKQRALLLAGAMAIALVLALLVGYLWRRAWAEEQEALRQASVLLASQAEAELQAGYGDRAVLLALEALEKYPYTLQAERALGQAVSYNRALQQYTGHQSAATSVAWSPDGRRVASSASTDNDVHIWDPVTGETELVIEMPTGITGNIYDMALNVQWTPDGKHLLIVTGDRYTLGSQDYDVLLWDAATGELISSVEVANEVEPESGDQWVSFVNYPTGSLIDIAPQSGRLATAGGDNTAILWDDTWQGPEMLLRGHSGSVNSVDLSPDEAMLVTASLDGTARIWDTVNGKELHVLEGHEGRVNLALWSPDGARVAAAGEDGTLRIWDASSGDLMTSIQTEGEEVWSLAWAPNGLRIVTGHEDGSLRTWEVASGLPLEVLRGHEGIITDLKWSQVDDRLASADGGGFARIWNAAPSTAWRLYPPQAARGGDWSVQGASWSSDGHYLVMAGGDNFASTEPPSFNIWDVEANQLIMENLGDALNFNGMEAHFSPDDSAILYLGYEQFPDFSGLATAYVFDASTGQIRQKFTPGGEDLIRSAAWSPDGNKVATGLFSGGVLIWDTQTGNKVTKLIHDTPDMFSAAVQWSPDGSKFAAGFDDSIVRVWDAKTWEELYAVHHEAPTYINAVDWSPDGKYLLTAGGNDERGGKDNTARIWDGDTGQELLVFSGHTMSSWPGDWSPSGKRAVTSSNDGTVRIWDTSTGDQLLTLSVPLTYGLCAWWSPDGQHLAIAGLDTLVSVWRVWQSSEELVDYAKECCLFRELTAAERERFALPPR